MKNSSYTFIESDYYSNVFTGKTRTCVRRGGYEPDEYIDKNEKSSRFL